MLPVALRSPPSVEESSIDETVSLDVASQLVRPVRTITSRLRAVLGTSVPEAPIDEYGNTSPREHDVWAHHPVGKTQGTINKEPQSGAVQV
jgi:hypothetical protein